MKSKAIFGRTSRASTRLVVLLFLAVMALVVVVAKPGHSAPGDTVRASVDSSGNEAYGDSSGPSLSTDGRYVAFASEAYALTPDDTNNKSDIFVKDLQTGETSRVSVSSAGDQSNGASNSPHISTDGRYVAFYSYASNLVTDDTNNKTDVFVHDLQTGETRRVSTDGAGNQSNQDSYSSSISADGRFVAFGSFASNLVPNDAQGNNGGGLFVKDLQTGETRRADTDSSGNVPAYSSTLAGSISADGRYVAFASRWRLAPDDTSDHTDAFVKDLQTGETRLVSTDSSGNQWNNDSADPSISADGRYVAFLSATSSRTVILWDGTSAVVPVWNVYAKDLQTGETRLVSEDRSGGKGNLDSADPTISADGSRVLFSSDATNLATRPYSDIGTSVFMSDLQTGQTYLVSVNSSGDQGTQTNRGEPHQVSISADGNHVAFDALELNLVPDDSNASKDVFVHEPDTQAPDAAIGSGPPDTVSGGSARFGFSANEADSTFLCKLDALTFTACNSPKAYSGLSNGDHTFSVKAVDKAGNIGLAVSRTWTIAPETTSQTVAAGEAVTSDAEGDGATASDPVETSITSPTAGPVSIEESAAVTQSSAGYSLLGQQVNIEAPASTADNPLRFVFTFDSTLIPTGENETTIQVFRNGTPLEPCADQSGTASPDPCVFSRMLLADGDVDLSVLTSHASAWNFGMDDIPPVRPVISNPVNNSYDLDGTIAFSGTAEANSTVKIFEGTTLKGSARANTEGSWSKTLSGVANGGHTYTAKATDAANNTSAASAARIVTVDTLKPTISGMSPRHTSITRDTTPTIKATVKDNLTDLQKANVKLYVKSVLISPTKWSYSAATGALTYNSPRLTLGKKTVKVVATDAAGNVSTKSWYFTIQ